MNDSSITTLTKANVLRSRSTVICLACLATLLCICCLVVKAGYFTGEFGAMALLVLREMIAASLGHQLKTEPKNGELKPAS